MKNKNSPILFGGSAELNCTAILKQIIIQAFTIEKAACRKFIFLNNLITLHFESRVNYAYEKDLHRFDKMLIPFSKKNSNKNIINTLWSSHE